MRVERAKCPDLCPVPTRRRLTVLQRAEVSTAPPPQSQSQCRVRRSNGGDSQVEQAGPSNIGGDEFASRLHGRQQQGQVSGRFG